MARRSTAAVVVAMLSAAAALLILLSQATTHVAAQYTLDELCYQVSWNLGSPNPRREAIRPIYKFPGLHSLVQNTYCGTHFNEGDRVPDSGSFYVGNQCRNVDGSLLYYAYGHPYGSSSNTGYEQSEADLLYFVVDESLRVSFVLVHDVPNDGTGGYIDLTIDSPDIGGKGTTILLFDDNVGRQSSCSGYHNDCWSWDTNTGYGEFTWAWLECCTDGMVLGHITDLEWRFNIQYNTVTDIDKFKIGTFSEDTGAFDFLTLDQSEVLASGIEVSAVACSTYCALKTNCGECLADQACGWCPSLGCIPKDKEDTCPMGETYQETGCCAECAALTNCTSCINAPGCGWSYELATCYSFSEQRGVCEDVMWFQPYSDALTECTANPGGPVFENQTIESTLETDPVIDWCLGRGEFDFEAQTCDCEYGFLGRGCASECPGGGDNPCSGNGICDGTVGQCYCYCGFEGVDCSVTGCPCTDENCFLDEGNGCRTVCGRNYGFAGCTGVDARELGMSQSSSARIAEEDGICACDPRFWGPECTNACPGIDADDEGSGTVCGGNGRCDVVTGECICDSCYEPDPDTGLCVLKQCPACMNQGQCFCGDDGDMHCSCKGQFTGELCEECDCANGGVCNSISGACQCMDGFLGSRCHFECTDDTVCHSHGTCNGPLERCVCDADYVGDADHQCEFFCPEGTCLNGGMCSLSTGECECPLPYFGEMCESNQCELGPCLNGGACAIDQSVLGFGYRCDCQPGYEGQNCEIDIDECLLGNDCFGAICVDGINSYTCSCKPGHFRLTATTCIEVNECLSGISNCDDNAACTNTNSGYTCTCNEGYSGNGRRCNDVDECSTSAHDCVDSARCVNTEGSYECRCPRGTSGNGLASSQGCQTHCQNTPCKNGGVCSISDDGSTFSCDCQPGYEGDHCTINATVCAALDPCISGATCINGPVVGPDEFPQFTCDCAFGFDNPACYVLLPSASTALSTGATAGIGAAATLAAIALVVIVVLVGRARSSSQPSDAADADGSHSEPTTPAMAMPQGKRESMMSFDSMTTTAFDFEDDMDADLVPEGNTTEHGDGSMSPPISRSLTPVVEESEMIANSEVLQSSTEEIASDDGDDE